MLTLTIVPLLQFEFLLFLVSFSDRKGNFLIYHCLETLSETSSKFVELTPRIKRAGRAEGAAQSLLLGEVKMTVSGRASV